MLNKVRKLFYALRFYGLLGIVRLIKARSPFCVRAKNYSLYLKEFSGKSGLEIGGPSRIFQPNNVLPLYAIINKLDGCNFSSQTLWEGNLVAGPTYKFNQAKPCGQQFICDAADLQQLQVEQYDFIVASHCLEHLANPLKALKQWIRLIKKGGVLLLVLPNARYGFDHRRPVTLFSHFQSDFENNIGEDDLSHLPEILKLHDFNLDRGVGNCKEFSVRANNNFEIRGLHHHVFDLGLLQEIFNYLNLEILDCGFIGIEHLVIMGRK